MRAQQNDHFPLLYITLLLEEVGGYARYTFMDGYAGYNLIFIALQDIHKTAFTTPWVTFVWVVMPFGLCNARLDSKGWLCTYSPICYSSL